MSASLTFTVAMLALVAFIGWLMYDYEAERPPSQTREN